MGNVSGKLEDVPSLYLRDQYRRMHLLHIASLFKRSMLIKSRSVSLASLHITNGRGRLIAKIVPNAFPSSRVLAKKDPGDDGLVEYVQVWILAIKHMRLISS